MLITVRASRKLNKFIATLLHDEGAFFYFGIIFLTITQ